MTLEAGENGPVLNTTTAVSEEKAFPSASRLTSCAGHNRQEETPMGEVGIFVDFGSTYTKVAAFDLDEEVIVGRGRSESTVKTDLTIGLKAAFKDLEEGSRRKCVDATRVRLACSSAAGGLRLVVIGLVPSLSLSAGRMAALGAGAKLVGNYSYKLNESEMAEIRSLAPDIILLVGGTDGGNEEASH